MKTRISAEEVAVWTQGRWLGEPPGIIAGVGSDTRNIKAGYMFVAIRGENFDGHNFLHEAFSKGACAAMVSSGTGCFDSRYPLLVVDDTLEGLAGIARGYRRRVNPLVIVVTGSVGKSTVTGMLAAIISRVKKTAKTLGNWNNNIGLPLSILNMEDDCETAVFEIGMNRSGEIAQLCGIVEPDWGVITNIGPVHLEAFGSEKEIALEKGVLFTQVASGGKCVLDRDCAFYDDIAEIARGELVTFGRDQAADYFYEIQQDGTVSVTHTEGRFDLTVPQPGDHNRLNAVAAAVTAVELGINPNDIQAGLDSYKPLPMRWQRTEAAGRIIINDAYNANPLSMKKAIETFAQTVTGRKWLALGGMLELGSAMRALHRDVGSFAAQGSWAGIAVVGKYSNEIADGALEAGFPSSNIIRCNNNSELADALAEKLVKGDAVLFKGSRGFRMEEAVDLLTKKLQYKEKETANESDGQSS